MSSIQTSATMNDKPTQSEFTVDAASGEITFNTAADFQLYANEQAEKWEKTTPTSRDRKTRPCYYLYKGGVYEVSEFVPVHPGGAELLGDYAGKDISVVFHDEYNQHGHTDKALNMMLQYRVGHVKRVQSAATGQSGEFENYQLEELTAYPKITEKEIIYNDFTIRRDRGLVWQAMFLDVPQYMHLISTPIYVPYCRLFDTFFVEPFSKTKYWLVAALWFPLSLYWLFRGIFLDNSQHPERYNPLNRFLYYPNRNYLSTNYPAPITSDMSAYIPASLMPQNGTAQTPLTPDAAARVAELQYQHAVQNNQFMPLLAVLLWASGVLLWTLMEYTIHRYPFHLERRIPTRLFDTPVMKMLHLALHGIHHIIPMDPDRLVFPPAMFVVAAYVIYNLVNVFVHGNFLDVLMSGVCFGYVCYDEIHYLIHHVDPTVGYFKDLKKYHHAHHYVDDTKGYGISNKLWDIVFRTECRKA